MPPAGPRRCIIALLAFACLAFVVAMQAGLPAQQSRQAVASRMVTLERLTADADSIVSLLQRAEAEVLSAAQGDAYRLAEVATTQALLTEALARLAEGGANEPALRPRVGAISVLARLRNNALGRGTPDDLSASPAGRAQLQAARLAADQIAVASAQRHAVERQAMLQVEQRLELVYLTLFASLSALATAVLLGWQASRKDRRQLHNAQAALGLLHDNGPVGLGVLDRDLVFVAANPRLVALLMEASPSAGGVLGLRLSEVSPLLASLVLPNRPMRRGPVLSGTQSAGGAGSGIDPTPSIGMTIEVPRVQPGEAPAHWFVGLRPVASIGEWPTALSIVVIDVSASIRAEAERNTLIRELNHRVKNTFATVQSVAAQTLRTSDRDFERFGQDFMGRLMALARSHDLISARAFGAISLADVAAVALEPFRAAGQIAIAGAADVTVRPAQAQALVIALFEMGANAARHGALLRPEGRVTLRWDGCVDGTGVRLLWAERGGPDVAPPPRRRGFGLRLLERSLAHDLGDGAVVTLHFDSAGLRCEMHFLAEELPTRAAA